MFWQICLPRSEVPSRIGCADYEFSLDKYLVVGKLVPVSEAPKE